MLMLGSVLVALAILTQYAGAWGVPYFSFTTDRDSTCKNGLAGYTCSAMTLADVEQTPSRSPTCRAAAFI
jgi:hypothetical protein